MQSLVLGTLHLDKIIFREGNIAALLENDTNDPKEGIVSTLIPFDPLKNIPQARPAKDFSREKGGRRRKRRCVNPSYMPEIRIYRRDIRRRYGEMFTNVINMHDVAIMRQFLEEFFRPDCQIIKVLSSKHQIPKFKPCAVLNKPMTTRHEMLHDYYYSCEMMPDSTMQLLESQVRVRQGAAGSLVVAKSLIKGTKLFAVKLIQQLTRNDTFILEEEAEEKMMMSTFDDLSGVECNYADTPSSSSSYTEDAAVSMNLADDSSSVDGTSKLDLTELDTINNHEVQLDPLNPPIETLAELVLVMVLNETNRVKELHVEHYPLSEKPFSSTAE